MEIFEMHPAVRDKLQWQSTPRAVVRVVALPVPPSGPYGAPPEVNFVVSIGTRIVASCVVPEQEYCH
jgi:hypothetical protein